MVAQLTNYSSSAIAFVPFALAVFATTAIAGTNQSVDDIVASSPTEARFQSARDASRTGDFELAKQEYAKLMLDEPDNVDYILGYAQVLSWSGNLERSLHFLEQARKLAPDYEDIWKLEYRARVTSTREGSSVSLDQFQQLAAARFPNAVWHRKTSESDSKKYRWEFSAEREYLDNGAPDWEQFSAVFGRNVTARTLVTLSASTMIRFGTTDTQFGFSGIFDMGANWNVTSSLAISSSPSFLPDTAIELGLSRRFERGWVGGVRWRRRDYEIASVDSFALVTERYFGKYRIAYSLDSARLFSEQSFVHALAVNFYADSGFLLGVNLAAGEEVEIVGPGQLLKADVNSIAFTGRHPVNEHLGFGWRLATHRQGQFYRRNAIGISIYGGF